MSNKRAGRPCSAEPSDSTFDGSVAINLRTARLRLGLTMEEASQLTGGIVSSATIGHIESGKYGIKLRVFCALSAAYMTRPTQLLPVRARKAMVGGKRRPSEVLRLLRNE